MCKPWRHSWEMTISARYCNREKPASSRPVHGPTGITGSVWRCRTVATNVKVILQRIEAKDYQDIAAMIRFGISLSHGFAGARTLYGPAFQPSESLKALVYFEEGDLHRLTEEERTLLIEAASALRALPTVGIRGKTLALSEVP